MHDTCLVFLRKSLLVSIKWWIASQWSRWWNSPKLCFLTQFSLRQEAASVLTVGLEDQLRGAFQWRLQGPLFHRCFFSRTLTMFCFIKEQKQVFMVTERTRFILKALMCNFCFVVFILRNPLVLYLEKLNRSLTFQILKHFKIDQRQSVSV